MRDETKQRIIGVEVFVTGNKVKCKLDKDTKMLLDVEDQGYKEERDRRDKEARGNQGKNLNALHGEKFVHLHDVEEENEKDPDHATIHLFSEPKDQIRWFTQDPKIRFKVSIQRNPELVQVLPGTSLEITPNVGIDNPFETFFPKDGLEGSYEKAVLSGPLRMDNGYVFLQRYYKYTVKVEGYKPYDPDVEGHYGD
jgi:hypothetical protein